MIEKIVATTFLHDYIPYINVSSTSIASAKL